MLTIRNNVYVWDGERHTWDIPKKAGLKFNPAHKLWWTKSITQAKKLLPFADPDTKARIEAIVQHQQRAIADSYRLDADLDIPRPAGFEFFPYQRGGVAFSLERQGVLIADEMGLGKTIQAIGVINASDVEDVLIVCPASLKINWRKELEKWLVSPLRIAVEDGKSWDTKADIHIVNYDILTKKKEVLAKEWGLVVLDESHYIKNERAKRTKAATAIRSKRRMALTGTPILNRPVELYTTLHWLDPAAWPDFWSYARRYCGAYQGQWGWDFTGASNIDELNEKLRSTVMVRRMKGEVMKDLPPKRRQVVELPATGDVSKLLKSERDMLERASGLAYEDAVDMLTDGGSVAFDEISKTRREVALAKVDMVLDFLTDALEGGGKVVVFAHHRDVIAKLTDGLRDFQPAVITGSTSEANRDAAVVRFQTDADCRVFIGNIKAAGVGLTLTASSHVIFAELDWTPGWVQQAEDRCHRIGQKESVLVQHLVLEDSIDALLAKAIVRKQSIAEKALG